MAKNYYFLKLHYDILDDWKVGTLPDSLKWLFIQCLCVAGETSLDGWLPDINQFAYRIRSEPSKLTADLARLASNQLIELAINEDGQERWYVTNYTKRQEKISNAQRQSDYRKRQRQKESKNNANVADKSRPRYDRVTIRNADQNRIDIEESENRVDVDVDFRENEPPHEIMSAIACVVKETYMPGFNDDKFEQVANAIIGLNAAKDIPGFSEWWQRNSYYSDNGKASLKTFADEFQNYLDGVERVKVAIDNSQQLTQTQINIQKAKEKHGYVD